jgi:Zn-dependent protease with chaperone function
MYILKTILLYSLVALFPGMLIYLSTSGAIQAISLSLLSITLSITFLFSDKFVLAFLGAREIIDSDSPRFFQLLKTETYREVENLPAVYTYTGHRVKTFVLNLRGSWSIVIERSLLESLTDDQARALVKHLINIKRKNSTKTQIIGMGISAIIIKIIYWLPKKLTFNSQKKKYKSLVFISLIMLKPMIEMILFLAVNKEKVYSEDELKPIYLKVDHSILNRPFIEFMLMHLESNISFKDCIVEYLEGFPLLENCKFKGVLK